MGLIDTDVLIENLKNDPVGKTLIAHYNLDGFIKSQPTVDAEPHWILCGDAEPEHSHMVLISVYEVEE